MAGSMKGQAVQTPQHLQRVAQRLMATQKARHSASKYDFVKASFGSWLAIPLHDVSTMHQTLMLTGIT